MRKKTTKLEKFEVIYESYADDVYKVCLYLTGDKTLAQRIAEQTFIDAYDWFENVNQDYLFAYLVRKAKDLVNRQKNSTF